MRKGTKVLGISVIAMALGGTPTVLAGAGDDAGDATMERQPLMRGALANIEGAIGHLEKATHDKGGHRVKAIALARAAAAEVKAGIAFDNVHDADELDVTMAGQPLMRAALRDLQAARGKLTRATHDKGGHRVKALALVNDAIEQVNKGMTFDDVHRRR